MSATAHDALRARADAIADELVRWRRALHERPELGFEEHETAAFLKERLEGMGLEVRTGFAGTGLVARIPAEESRGPAVLLRADMDGLPIQEVDGREYGSRNRGRMHACGHDGHMAMLLGAATLLGERRAELSRDVLLCFQPGEEGFGGALRMIEDGVLDWVEVGSVFALHLWSPFPVGTAHVRPGPIMAAQDEFVLTLFGEGGHAALPHRTVDPIVAAAQVVTALQSVVSRNADPLEAAVLSIGTFEAGTAANIIPKKARLTGTMRSFDPTVRELLRRRSREVAEGVAAACGCRPEFELLEGYPATVNDEAAATHARRRAEEVFGEEAVFEPAPLAAAEDFSYFLERRPGAFVLVGAGNERRGITAPHHSAEFDIDEAALPRGAELLTRLALSARSARSARSD